MITGDDIDGFLAEAPELPGCVTAGEIVAEALALLHDAMAGWIESRLVHGDPIPEPAAAVQATSRCSWPSKHLPRAAR